MKYKILFFVILSFSMFSQSFSQQNNDLFDYDFAQFSYDSTSNYFELYYSFHQAALTLKSNDTSHYVEAILHISIKDTATGKPFLNKQWKLEYPVKDSTKMGEKNLVGLINFVLPTGHYRCDVSAYDKFNDKNVKNYSDILNVQPFEKDSLAVSDIQLASRIIQNSPNKSSIFYKNTFEVTPIPSLVFGENIPVVFYYYEVYEHMKGEPKEPLKISTIVANSKGRLFFNKLVDIAGGIPSRVEVGSIPINKFPTDTYRIRIAVIDSTKNIGMASSKRFFVYNPDIKVVDTTNSQQSQVLGSAFGVMSLEECDNIFNEAKYIATSEERDQYSKIHTVEAKRDFLFHFWKKRENNPAIPDYQHYQSYMKRVKEANQKFGSFNRPGWKTDRGRILLIYGEPSEIDRHPNEIDTKPYEIWSYNEIQGGVIFVFADLTGFSDYQLVHSTARGELQDSNWQSRITTN
jgi:GWxTD domain-containing protein